MLGMETLPKVYFVCLLIGQFSSILCAFQCEVDVAFLVDSSASIGSHNYEKEKAFVKEAASLLGIPTQSRGAVIVFGDNAKLSIDFHQARTLQQFDDLVQNIPYMRKTTRIDKALILAAKDVFPKARKHVVKIALVVTDGKLTQRRDTTPLAKASQPLRDQGVRVLAVGIGKQIKENELKEMVEKPEDVFLMESFDSLRRRVEEIANYTCNNTVLQNCLSLSRHKIQDPANVTLHNDSKTHIMSFLNEIAFLDVQDRRSLQNATYLLEDLFNFLQSNKLLESIPKRYIMCCVSRMEEFTLRFAEHHLTGSNHTISMETDRMIFEAKLITNNSRSEKYIFPSMDENTYGAMVAIPTKNDTEGGSFIVSILYKTLHRFLQEALNDRKQDNVGHLGTQILSVTMAPSRRKTALNVTLRFDTLPSVKAFHTNNQTCVFWNYGLSEEDDWSRKGCTVSRRHQDTTECSCNHLTHFAVLMQIQEQPISKTDEDALSIITYVGLGISLLGCALTWILLHCIFVNLRTQLSQIRINLVVSMGIGQIIFIAGIDATRNLAGCIAVAVFIQYFYLVAFCWMLVEGVQLYLHIVKVFNIEHGMIANYFFAWGFPSIVVTATVIAALTSKDGAAGFIHEKFCWLSFKNKLAWTFAGPVLAITLINIILLLHVIREMSKMDNTIGGSTSQLNIVRKTAKACIVLFPLLGITWLFGVLTMSEVGVAALYIFTILNSTQGFLIFILSCVRNSEIRSKIHAKLQSLHRSKPSASSVMPNPVMSADPYPASRDRMLMTENKLRANPEPSRLRT